MLLIFCNDYLEKNVISCISSQNTPDENIHVNLSPCFLDKNEEKKKAPSLRRDKAEEFEKFESYIQATPEFRNFIAGKLSDIFEKSLDYSSEKPGKQSKQKSKDNGIKLFKKSTKKFEAKEAVLEDTKVNKKRPDLLEHRKEVFENVDKAFESVAVSGSWIKDKKCPSVKYKGRLESKSKIIDKM